MSVYLAALENTWEKYQYFDKFKQLSQNQPILFDPAAFDLLMLRRQIHPSGTYSTFIPHYNLLIV